nr:MAG TPA: hypothetical protein [Bacteriophage sp.]
MRIWHKIGTIARIRAVGVKRTYVRLPAKSHEQLLGFYSVPHNRNML